LGRKKLAAADEHDECRNSKQARPFPAPDSGPIEMAPDEGYQPDDKCREP
jgi:hypothetical protein